MTMSTPLRAILALHSFVLGLGYLLGPPQWSSGTSFAVIKALGVPVPIWGAVFVLAAALLAAGRSTAGHGVAAVAYLFWGGYLAQTIFTGQIAGWGAPVHTIVLAAPLHLLALWRRSSAKAAS
jgi:hypothetical protein